MRSMSLLQLVGGVAVAGVVAAGTTALTGTGVSWGGTGTGTSAQYVGGTLTQTVSGGASITAVNYTTSSSGVNVNGDQITGIAVSVTGANGAYLTVTPATGGAGLTGGANEWHCSGDAVTVNSATMKVHLNNTPATVTCITADSGAGDGAAGYYAALTGVTLDVTNS
jgi:hypothetical protein